MISKQLLKITRKLALNMYLYENIGIGTFSVNEIYLGKHDLNSSDKRFLWSFRHYLGFILDHKYLVGCCSKYYLILMIEHLILFYLDEIVNRTSAITKLSHRIFFYKVSTKIFICFKNICQRLLRR